MKLVIDIPDKRYDQLCADAGKIVYINGMRSCKTILAELLEAIRKGKPLKEVLKEKICVDYCEASVCDGHCIFFKAVNDIFEE